jgi:hypothetical protein
VLVFFFFGWSYKVSVEVIFQSGCTNLQMPNFHRTKNTRCAWAGGTYTNYPDFCKNHQFHVIYCVNLAYVPNFEEFLTLNSRRVTIFKE